VQISTDIVADSRGFRQLAESRFPQITKQDRKRPVN